MPVLGTISGMGSLAGDISQALREREELRHRKFEESMQERQQEFTERQRMMPQALGRPVQGADGKWKQLIWHPSTGAIGLQEVPGYSELTSEQQQVKAAEQALGRRLTQAELEQIFKLVPKLTRGTPLISTQPVTLPDGKQVPAGTAMYPVFDANQQLVRYETAEGAPISALPTAGTAVTETDPFTGTTTTRRVGGKVMPGKAPAKPSVGMTAPSPAPVKAKLPAAVGKAAPQASKAAAAEKARWSDVAPAPAYYDGNGVVMVPQKFWPMVEQVAMGLRDGSVKVPAIGPKNAQLWGVVMARARELGWTGGPPPTTSQRDSAQWARKVLPHIPEARELISRLDVAGKLGPVAGRWNEFMAGTIGAGDPDYAKLRGFIGLLKTALMRQHVGARGGVRLLEHFTDLWNSNRMDAATLNASLDVMESFMQSYATLDVATPTAPASGAYSKDNIPD